MKFSTLFFRSGVVLAALVAHVIGQDVSTSVEKLVDFVGCSATQKSAIYAAYDEAIDMAYMSSGSIDWTTPFARDFLGQASRNKAYQGSLKKVINNVYTYRRAYFWNPEHWRAWKISIRCDDFHNLCSGYRAAAAYTVNPGKRTDGKPAVTVDTINVCWTVFSSKKTCFQSISDSGNPLFPSKNLNDFQCRGYILLHELFHLDSLSGVADGGHILDLGLRYQSGFDTKIRRHQMYGPTRTKVLALWPNDDMGKYVLTNADNLAQYIVAHYVKTHSGIYASEPKADGIPDTVYEPKTFNDTEAAEAATADADDDAHTVVSRGMAVAKVESTLVSARAVVATPDCNNKGEVQWATAPFASQSFAQGAVTTFCNAVASKKADRISVTGSGGAVLMLEAFSRDTTCAVSVSDCKAALGAVLSSCDKSSSDRKYGGVSGVGCMGYAMGLDGTRSATYMNQTGATWACAVMVQADTLSCACTDGKEYPLKDDACLYDSPGNTTTPGSTTPSADGQQVAVASYIHPLADTAAWTRLIGYPKDKVTVLVANVVNGPDSTVDSDWKSTISKAAASGKRVIGYVRTGYLGVSQQQFKTRLGSTNLADWVSQIESDVDTWYRLYGSTIGGIFFDEGWNSCGDNNVYSELYRYITDNTKRKYPGAFTVLNPGATMPQCFEHSADTLMTFESSYETYTTAYVDNGWVSADSRKLWHIIYNVPESQVARIAALAKERGAGLVEITNDVMPNPYDNLPSDSYMTIFMNAVSGGTPNIAEPGALSTSSTASSASTPGALTVSSFEYTSVSLSWSAAANAVGYIVYVNGVATLSLTATMTHVTIGNFLPGSAASTFQVSAMGGNGKESAKSNSVSSGTKDTPSHGRNIANVSFMNSATSTTYQANVLVPYAFTRIYIWNTEQGCHGEEPSFVGWPVNFNVANFVCAQYLVEGETLFKYSGTVTESTVNIPWAWTPIGTVSVQQVGYTYTWTVPLGSSTADTSRFVVQTQGYAAAMNVFTPCPATGGGPDGAGRYCS